MKLYDKDGKEYNVPHAIDVKDWIKDGYTVENPKAYKSKKQDEDGGAKPQQKRNYGK